MADDDQLLAVNEALEKFAAVDARKAELVKLRYFVGLNFEEAAAALGIAMPTAKQWWAYARAWLTVEMRRRHLPIDSANQALLPFGTCVSQVWPDSGWTWVKPVPAGGLGMRMRCCRPDIESAGRRIAGSHFSGWSQWEQ